MSDDLFAWLCAAVATGGCALTGEGWERTVFAWLCGFATGVVFVLLLWLAAREAKEYK